MDLETLKQTLRKRTKGRVSHSIFHDMWWFVPTYNSHYYFKNLNRCKFDFARDPRQVYEFGNAMVSTDYDNYANHFKRANFFPSVIIETY